MSDDKEREDLEALLKSPGWLRFQQALRKEWTGRFDDYVAAAVGGQRDALTELMKLSAARSAILAALKYPEERLRQLDDAARTRALDASALTLSRGGIL